MGGGASRTCFSCAAVAEREKGRSRGGPASARPDAESVSQSAGGNERADDWWSAVLSGANELCCGMALIVLAFVLLFEVACDCDEGDVQ